MSNISEREMVRYESDESREAREVCSKIIDLLKGHDGRVIALTMMRVVASMVHTFYERTDDRIEYAVRYGDALVETIKHNAEIN